MEAVAEKPVASGVGFPDEEREATCETCGGGITYRPMILAGVERFRPHECDGCHDLRERSVASRGYDALADARKAAWAFVCPPEYADTEPVQLSDAARNLIADWTPEAGRGVGIVGETRRRKTRTAYEILKRWHFAGGHRVEAINGVELSRAITEQFDDDRHVRTTAKERLADLERASILLLDDVGKGRFTDRGSSEFFGLVEYRTARKLPIIWTLNADAKLLTKMLGEDRGAPTVERLREYSEILEL